MSRFGLGSVLGAGAAGAYGMQQVNSQGFGSVMGKWIPNWEGIQMPQASPQSAELTALQKEMSKLAGMVSDIAKNNNNRPTVVQLGGNQRGWSVIIYPALAGGIILYIYCKVTGNSVFDFFYVSRSSMANFRNTVQESMTKMWEEMRKQKEEVVRMVTSLGRKQDDLRQNQDQLMAKQDQMDERLRKVDDAVYQLDSKASHTIQHVEKLDTRLQDVHSGVLTANQGIYMLVSAVSEVTNKIGLHNSRAAQALSNYARSGPAWLGGSASVTAPNLPAPSTTPQLTAAPSAPTPMSGGLRGLMPDLDSLPTTSFSGENGFCRTGSLITESSAPTSTGGSVSSAVGCLVQEVPAASSSSSVSTPKNTVMAQGLRVLGFK